MAGTNPAFNAADFRTAIRQAMEMGAPIDPDDRVTFKWNPVHTYTGPVDVNGVPYDINETPATTTSHADVQVPVAIEWTAGTQEDTAIGAFDTSTGKLTILDEDYAQIAEADYLLIGGHAYDITQRFPGALFDAGYHLVMVRARSRA